MKNVSLLPFYNVKYMYICLVLCTHIHKIKYNSMSSTHEFTTKELKYYQIFAPISRVSPGPFPSLPLEVIRNRNFVFVISLHLYSLDTVSESIKILVFEIL